MTFCTWRIILALLTSGLTACHRNICVLPKTILMRNIYLLKSSLSGLVEPGEKLRQQGHVPCQGPFLEQPTMFLFVSYYRIIKTVLAQTAFLLQLVQIANSTVNY